MEENVIDIWQFDKEIKEGKAILLCGVDEAGRGPLAGPVVAAAVILNQGVFIEGLNDSKKLSEKKRDSLFPVIKENSHWGVGIATNFEIDEINILNATFLAMQRAVEALDVTPSLILVDGNSDPHLNIDTVTVVKGDLRSASIAAASIIAKVTRDNIMSNLDEKYDVYNFKKHKGYGTKEHYSLLSQYGMSDIHRKTFFKKHKIQ